jgi:predicted transcriptional regulator of viral defense system
VTRPAAEFSALDYFNKFEVFRREEFIAAHMATGRARATSETLLRYHLAHGRLHVLRRGVYCITNLIMVDPWVVACKLTRDGVVAYHGAAAFHWMLPLGKKITVISSERMPEVPWDLVVYRCVRAADPRSDDQLVREKRGENTIWVTSKERTLVDLLDRLDLCEGPRAVWDAFIRAKDLDPDALVRRAQRLGNKSTAARLGLYLEHLGGRHRNALERLERMRPTSPAYFNRGTRKSARQVYLPRWNLVAPHQMVLHLQANWRS